MITMPWSREKTYDDLPDSDDLAKQMQLQADIERLQTDIKLLKNGMEPVGLEPKRTQSEIEKAAEERAAEAERKGHEAVMAKQKAEMKLMVLQNALRPMILRLKVLDIHEVQEEMGEDGMLPMKMMVSELRELVDAWDEEGQGYIDCTTGSYSRPPHYLVI